MSIFLTRFDGRFAHLAINGGLKMKYAREFIVNAVVGLVLLPIYLAALVLLKGMRSVVGLLRPIAALLPDWVPAENFLSLVVVLIICFAVGSAVRTRAGRAVRERMEMLFFGRLPGYALFRGLSQRHSRSVASAPRGPRLSLADCVMGTGVTRGATAAGGSQC
jgi:hypothetical protein